MRASLAQSHTFKLEAIKLGLLVVGDAKGLFANAKTANQLPADGIQL